MRYVITFLLSLSITSGTMAMYSTRNNHQGLRYRPYDQGFSERYKLERKVKLISDSWRKRNAEFDRSRKAGINNLKAQEELEKVSLDKLYSLLELDELEIITINDALKTQTKKDMSTFYANLNKAGILGKKEISTAKILYCQPLKKATTTDLSNIPRLLFSIASHLSICSSDRHLKSKKSIHSIRKPPSAVSSYKSEKCARTHEYQKKRFLK